MVREDCPSDAAKKQNESSDETKLAEQKRTRELQSFGIALLPRVIPTLLPVYQFAPVMAVSPDRITYGRVPASQLQRLIIKDASIKKAPITAYRLKRIRPHFAVYFRTQL